MRSSLWLLLALPAAAAAQVESAPPPPGIGVERTTMAPGEARAFTLSPGTNHQLLTPAALDAKNAVTVRYSASGGGSTISLVNRTGHPLGMTVLADPDGDGGFTPVGDMMAAGNGVASTRTFPGALGTINVGDFVGAPHGANGHEPSGDPVG